MATPNFSCIIRDVCCHSTRVCLHSNGVCTVHAVCGVSLATCALLVISADPLVVDTILLWLNLWFHHAEEMACCEHLSRLLFLWLLTRNCLKLNIECSCFLHHRLSTSKSFHCVEGWHYASGGKRCPCVPKKGKHTSLQVLLCLISSACKGVTWNWLATYLYYFQVLLRFTARLGTFSQSLTLTL